MPTTPVPSVALTPVGYFPEGYFLENLAVRADGSVLVSSLLTKELWCVPGPEPGLEVAPVLAHTFEHNVWSIVEVEPEIFIISLSDAYTTHESHLARIDLTGWAPGDPVWPEIIYTFDYRVQMLNGACLFAPGVMLIADALAGLIWRVDLGPGAHSARARIWMEHSTMAPDLDNGMPPPPQPGINGIHYGPKTRYVYYTGLAQMVFMRIPVDAETLEPAGSPEFVAPITDGDDFCIDEVAGFAYVARHRANTLDRVPLEPGHSGEVRHLAGDPLNEELLGLCSVAWGRGPTDTGRAGYITIDGGRTAPPPDGNIHNAALVRVELLAGRKPRTPAWEKVRPHPPAAPQPESDPINA